MTVDSLQATVQGTSLLDIGHFQVRALQLNIADSSGVILSGGTLRGMKKI